MTHQKTGLLIGRHSGIRSGGSSLFPLDIEGHVPKRVESALDDVRRM